MKSGHDEAMKCECKRPSGSYHSEDYRARLCSDCGGVLISDVEEAIGVNSRLLAKQHDLNRELETQLAAKDEEIRRLRLSEELNAAITENNQLRITSHIVHRLREALPDPKKLELLARWFDKEQDAGRWAGKSHEVQDDLRRMAAIARAALEVKL